MCPHESEFLVLHLTLDQEACGGTEGVLRRGDMGEANYGAEPKPLGLVLNILLATSYLQQGTQSRDPWKP